MKITELELFHIAIPFAEPYKLSKVYGTLENAHAVIIKVRTDKGIIGLGEADPMNPFTEETPGSVMAVLRDHIGPLLIGRDPTQIASIESFLDQVVHGQLMARGAVNMALYDILGKLHRLPAYVFLGGCCRENLPLLGPIGSGTPEEDAESIESLIQQGYRTVMLKMGALSIAEEIKRTISAIKRFGERISIILDPNQGWQLKEAMAFIEGIRGFYPDMMEQPIGRSDLKGLQKIRNAIPCLLSVDESLISVQDAVAIIGHGAADVFSIKVSKNGGLTKSLWLAKVAEAFGIKCFMNSMLEFGVTQAASVQLGCSLNNLVEGGHAFMSVLRMSDDVTDFDHNISNAVVTVPQEPGLGVILDEKKLQSYTLEYMQIVG
jgi:muconate cycloisomerase